MKIKISFVTNSSSTSFVGFGIRIYDNASTREKLIEAVKKRNPDEEFDDDTYLYEILESLFDDNKDSLIGYASGEDLVIMGCEFIAMPMEMTRKEFQEKIENELKELGFEDKPHIIDLTWYN